MFDCFTSHKKCLCDNTPFNDFLLLAKLCNEVYKEPHQIINSDIDLAHIFISVAYTDLQCYIFYNDNTIYVCFRGTSSIKDSIIDVDINQSTFFNENVKIHNGFLKQYLSCRELLQYHLQHIIADFPDIKTIVSCGHSLGGALATIAAIDISLWFTNHNLKCFTIGSPRVGNKAFCKLFTDKIKNTYRLVNHSDPIQYIPMSHKYHHVCPSICFFKNNRVQIKMNNVPVQYRCCNAIKNIDFTDMVEPHRCTTYIDNIVSKLVNNV